MSKLHLLGDDSARLHPDTHAGRRPQSRRPQSRSIARCFLMLCIMPAAGLLIGIGSSLLIHGDWKQGFEANERPVLNQIPVHYAAASEPIHFRVRNTNAGYVGRSLRFRLEGNFPRQAKLIPMTGRFAWTPGPEDFGLRYQFDVVADEPDRAKGVARTTVTIDWQAVDEERPLRAPVVEPMELIRGNVGHWVSVQVQATLPNRRPMALRYELGTPAPPGAVINAQTGRFRWAPSAEFNRHTVVVPLRVVGTAYRAGRVVAELESASSLTIQVGKKLDVPELFPVESLQAVHGAGMFRVRREAPLPAEVDHTKTSLANVEWIVLTGVVPVARQEAEFKRALNMDPRAPHADPGLQYLSIRVDRAEITHTSEGSPERIWKPLEMPSRFQASWASTTPEAASPAVVHPRLTSPLGPLEYQTWGDEVLHPQIESLLLDQRGQERHGRTSNLPPENIGVLLFRCFDFGVEPKRTYRYRVRLLAAHPHQDRDRRVLSNPATAGTVKLASAWSAPSAPVSTPARYQLEVGDSISSRVTSDRSVNVLIRAFDPRLGIFVSKDFNLTCGQVANFLNEDVTISGKGGTAQPAKADFVTNQQLVDMAGGQQMHPRYPQRAPVELLMMDATGRISTLPEPRQP